MLKLDQKRAVPIPVPTLKDSVTDLLNYLNRPIAPPIEQVGPSDTISGEAQCTVCMCVCVCACVLVLVGL